MEFITHTWHWAISGFLIGLVLLLLLLFGNTFGVSSNLRTICTMAGAGKLNSFFDVDWRAQIWNLTVLAGAMLGGFVAVHFLSDGSNVAISSQTITELEGLGIDYKKGSFLPDYFFGEQNAFSLFGFLFLLMGGLLIGFGSRYAGGCTSGHAITGLSSLQRASLKAVFGFFIGGLVMVHFILPIFFKK